MTANPSIVSPDLSPLKVQIESFLHHLNITGYAPTSVTRIRSIIHAFVRGNGDEQIAMEEINEAHLTAFLKRRPLRYRTIVERRALRQFLAFLYNVRALPAPEKTEQPSSPIDDLMQRYIGYLRTDRGLAKNSLLVYAPCVRDFLAFRLAQSGCLSLETLDAETIRGFLIERVPHLSSESARLLSIALRSLLRFLFLRGEAPCDLSPAVPMVRTYRQSTVPAMLSPEEVEKILATINRSNMRGRRDYAILLLLARLGLRAGEIASLEISDIHWRTGEIVVRGKGSRLEHVPLLADVGEAIALYLQKDRGASISRRIFLRLVPPRIGLAGPSAIDHIVRLALARAEVCPRYRRVAHLFRHSLATRMIRHGASISEIAEVLRHRSQSTTAIYAKVSFEALRSVARPWPVREGEK